MTAKRRGKRNARARREIRRAKGHAADVAKAIAGFVPGVGIALGVYDLARSGHRLTRSVRKAAQAVGTDALKAIGLPLRK